MLETLSYSSLSRFAECAQRFQGEKMGDLLVEQTYSQESVRGTIVHKFMEDLMNIKIDSGDYPTVGDARSMMEDVWTKGFITKENDQLNILEAVDWYEDFFERSVSQSIELVDSVYNDVLHLLDPIQAESMLELDLPVPGKQIKKLRGVVDLISQPNHIIDWKTSTRVRNEATLKYDIQSTVYTALSGMDKASISFIQFIFQKTGARIEIGTTRRDLSDVNWLLHDYIPRVINLIESGLDLPPSPGWHCTNCPVKCGVAL